MVFCMMGLLFLHRMELMDEWFVAHVRGGEGFTKRSGTPSQSALWRLVKSTAFLKSREWNMENWELYPKQWVGIYGGSVPYCRRMYWLHYRSPSSVLFTVNVNTMNQAPVLVIHLIWMAFNVGAVTRTSSIAVCVSCTLWHWISHQTSQRSI